MKKFLTAILTLTFIVGCAATKPIAEADREQIFVVNVENKSQEEILNAAKVWIAQNYVSAKAVTEYTDSERIIGNGTGDFPCSGMACMSTLDKKYHYTMTIDAKDNKYRIVFSNLRLSYPPSFAGGVAFPAYNGPLRNQQELLDIKPELAKISEGIKLSMNKQINTNSDW